MDGWSEKYYPGLTEQEHRANNIWFRDMLTMLTDAGMLAVPSLRKTFNKQGEEISPRNEEDEQPARNH